MRFKLHKVMWLACFLVSSAPAGASQQTLESLDLFDVYLGQTEPEAVAILKSKATPKTYKDLCVSQWIAREGGAEMRELQRAAACLKSAESRIEPQDGEIKTYVVEFTDDYRRNPGVGVVSAVEYRHEWDTRKITQTFDPYERVAQRFGPHQGKRREQSNASAWWKYEVGGETVKVLLKYDCYPSINCWTEGYVIRVEYDFKDRERRDAERLKLLKDSHSTNTGSEPDF